MRSHPFAQTAGEEGRALRSSRAGGRGPSFVSIRGGMGRLVDALVAGLPAGTVRLERPARGVEADGAGFRVRTPGGPLASKTDEPKQSATD